MPATDPPRPLPDADSAPFWQALSEGRMELQYSPEADHWQFPPLERCRHTGGPLEWRAICGNARVHSYIVQHRPAAPGFDDLAPYVLALASPTEAPELRLPVRMIDIASDAVLVGIAVRMEIERRPDGEACGLVARVTG